MTNNNDATNTSFATVTVKVPGGRPQAMEATTLGNLLHAVGLNDQNITATVNGKVETDNNLVLENNSFVSFTSNVAGGLASVLDAARGFFAVSDVNVQSSSSLNDTIGQLSILPECGHLSLQS